MFLYAEFERIVLPSGKVELMERVSDTVATSKLRDDVTNKRDAKRIDNPTSIGSVATKPLAIVACGVTQATVRP